VVAPRLFEIPLPEGDVQGMDIGYAGGDNRTKLNPADWLEQGYDGVRLIGKGVGRTHLLAEEGYHNSTLFVGGHNGIVSLESCTLHVAKAKAWHQGLALQPVYPKFCMRLRNVDVVADGVNPDGGRRVWGLFPYQCDQDLEDVTFHTADIAEHASYCHGGFAQSGLLWKRVVVNGCGSQACKVRFAPNEGRWVKGARIQLIEVSIKGAGQPHGWRGGGGLVVEGGNADIHVQRCGFYGRPGEFRHLMVDDGSGAFRSGTAPFANGRVIVDACGFMGGPGSESYSPIMRVGSTAQNPEWPTAKAVLITGCAVYGTRVLGQFSNIPDGKLLVTGCNTPALKDIANAYGFDTRYEAQLVGASGTFVPFSAGVQR
jgi:hypothetical protein